MIYLTTNKGLFWFVAFKGATMYEFQVGPLYITLDQPRFWSWKEGIIGLSWDSNWKANQS